MDIYIIVLMLLIAAGAFFAGYQTGRLSALSGRRGADARTEDSPLPGPNVDRELSQGTAPPRRSAPPPASAGGAGGAAQAPGAVPRRSTKPPPAAAGLMSTGNGSVDKTSS